MAQAPSPRIHGGVARGRKLICPPGDATRPTMGKAKEALMSIMAPWLAHCTWLDAYAGSGGVGLEALSRGAAAVVFVERDAAALAALQRNLELLGLSGATLLPCSVAQALPRLQSASFDVLFADPPFSQDPAECAVLLGESKLLAPGGRIVLEHSSKAKAPEHAAGLPCLATRSYGATAFSFYGEG